MLEEARTSRVLKIQPDVIMTLPPTVIPAFIEALKKQLDAYKAARSDKLATQEKPDV
jgi:glycerol-3-phosphate responsive antiterminator